MGRFDSYPNLSGAMLFRTEYRVAIHCLSWEFYDVPVESQIAIASKISFFKNFDRNAIFS